MRKNTIRGLSLFGEIIVLGKLTEQLSKVWIKLLSSKIEVLFVVLISLSIMYLAIFFIIIVK